LSHQSPFSSLRPSSTISISRKCSYLLSTSLAVYESNPVVGSSKNKALGQDTNDIAIFTLFLTPPCIPTLQCRAFPKTASAAIHLPSSFFALDFQCMASVGTIARVQNKRPIFKSAVYISISSTLRNSRSRSNCSTYPTRLLSSNAVGRR